MNAGESTVARVEVCIVAQDVNQLNKEYTKDNSIASNCHVHIYFTPNLDSGGATAEAISKNLGKHTIKTVSHSDGGGLFKGSNSESFTGRELMTADEVSHMSSEKELVFVAGHKPIFGDKLRYYLQPFFLKRLNMYQGIYIKEHGCEKACKKYTQNGKHDCALCVAEYKKPNGLPPIPCPTYPLYSDSVTKVLSFSDLFAVHAADKEELADQSLAVQMEKEHQERMAKEGQTKSEVVSEQHDQVNVETEKEAISLEKKEAEREEALLDTNLPEDTAGHDDNQGQTVDEESAGEAPRSPGSQPEQVDGSTAPMDIFGGDKKEALSAKNDLKPQSEKDMADEANAEATKTTEAYDETEAETESLQAEEVIAEEILPEEEPEKVEPEEVAKEDSNVEKPEDREKSEHEPNTVSDSANISNSLPSSAEILPTVGKKSYGQFGMNENPLKHRENKTHEIPQSKSAQAKSLKDIILERSK